MRSLAYFQGTKSKRGNLLEAPSNCEWTVMLTLKYKLIRLIHTFASCTVAYNLNVFLAKSYGVPIKLTCADRQTTKINVSGISLFKWKKTVEANHLFPGIHAQSQSECHHTFLRINSSLPAECELSLSGRNIPSDFMIVTVYECVTASDWKDQMVHTSK